MRISYYFRYLNDPLGRGVHARSLVEAWSAGGNQVKCLPYPLAQDAPDGSIPFRGAAERVLPRPARHRLMQAYDHLRAHSNVRGALRQVETWESEVLVARWSQFDSTLDKLVKAVSCPAVAEVNAIIHTEMQRFRRARLPETQIRRELAYLRAADFALCISEEVREELTTLGVPRERSAVVSNGVDCGLFHPDVKRDEALERWARNGGGKLVAYCGTASLVHDMLTLLLSTEWLADAVPTSRFLFVGPLLPEVRQLISRRPDLADRIRVTGVVPHHLVPALLAPASLFWAAFANEYGSPLKELEYMAMGKPVVVAGAGSAARLIASAKCGTAVAIGDHRGLAEAAADVLRLHEREVDSLGRAGREWVADNASWSSTAESMLRIIRERVLAPDSAGIG